MSIQKLTIKGQRQPVTIDTSDDSLELKESFVLTGTLRGITESHEVQLKNTDLVELVFEDDTKWFCTQETLEDIFPAATQPSRGGDGSFEIPISIQSDSTERGLVGNILLKALNIFGKKAVQKEVRELAADLEKKHLENYSGLYRVNKNFQLQKFTADNSNDPYFLLIHGTNSSTKGSFGELINTELWNLLHTRYPNRVLALQHETLTKSPLQNVAEILEQLGATSRLHIMSHSRGGLVGDIICRCSTSDDNNRCFDVNEINKFKKLERKNDLIQIERIQKILTTKKIAVEKFIRVACPAAGTTLTSNRLDHFFNISLNLIGLGTGLVASPLYNSFRSLIAAVVDTKNDENILPGVEAMHPQSPFIDILNNPSTAVSPTHSMVIISGNCKSAFNLRALLIIASKLFYQHRNDLVVNTSSMFKGTKRKGVQYLMDEATDVDHFSYFKNKRTADAIIQVINATDEKLLPGFRLIEETSKAELERNALLNLDGGQVFSNTVTGTKPIVIVLPGIMGSNLSVNEKLVWINYIRFITGELTHLDINADKVAVPSIVRTSYGKLVLYLQQQYDVVTFAFDWRRQLNEVAIILKDKVEELLKYNQPIKVIGHSMGGVLFRDFMVTQKETWQRLNQSAGFKLIFLGAPLGGSFRIPYVLFGKDAIIDKLSKIDIFHSKKELLQMFCKFPGILSLLPLVNDNINDFSDDKIWRLMSKGLAEKDWPVPSATDLKNFKNYRDKIHDALDASDYENAVYVAGRDKSTPCGYRIDQTAAGPELVFLSTAEGDQSVTWETGIPKKMIETNSVYYVNVSHGSLANEASMFTAITELLAKGSTGLLSKTRPVVRGEEKLFKTPDITDFDMSADGIENTLLGLGTMEEQVVQTTPLKVIISKGDLRYASFPLLAGHFENDGILSAEKSIDNNLLGALTERQKLGIYAGKIATNDMLLNTTNGFAGAIIVGLGEFGKLNAFQLTYTVEQAATKYLLYIHSNKAIQAPGLSSLIIGSGYGGLSIEVSIRAICEGIQNANAKVRTLKEGNAKLIEKLEFIELFEDNALSCFYILKKIEADDSSALNIITDGSTIKPLLGFKKRIPSRGNEQWWWNRINVQMQQSIDGSPGTNCLQFSASTNAAREEQRNVYSSTVVLEELVADLSTNNRWSPELARAIFELLIPNDFKDQLKKQSNINWILDKASAAYPWELLQDSSVNSKPLSVNAGMIRQLSTDQYRVKINAVSKDNALVIADPDLKGYLMQLPGAQKEGDLVCKQLELNGFKTTSLKNAAASQIIQALFCDDYKLIHLAGHGLFNAAAPSQSGMVIGNNIFLSTHELAQMSTTPELVFVNCCFLGKTDAVAEELYRNRYRLAANIGTQLIENGVKAVVVAGWAVDDAAALDFTGEFYKSMFAGQDFGTAILKARKCVYGKYKANNTWGAYQCYGDPFYKFREQRASSFVYKPSFVIAEEAVMELYNLANEMGMGSYVHSDFILRLQAITDAVDVAGIRNAAITESEAMIYADLYEYNMAIGKFESLLSMEDAGFSVKVLEQYCNVRAKKYLHDYLKDRSLQKDLLQKMDDVLLGLENLLTISPTSERYNIMASCYKRKAGLSNGIIQKNNAYGDAAYFYHKAYSINPSAYALVNWLQMEFVLIMQGKRKWKQTVKSTAGAYQLYSLEEAIIKLKLAQKNIEENTNLEYFNITARAALLITGLLLEPSQAKDPATWDSITRIYSDAWKKAGTKAKRISETEQLMLLTDSLALSKNRNIITINKKMNALKDSLEKMI
ncbi:MAG: CHAT domain-containing protein [Ferruginibacter sp.]